MLLVERWRTVRPGVNGGAGKGGRYGGRLRAGGVRSGVAVVLTITGLADAEYVLGGVALGVEDYYVGAGEAPGVWEGRLAAELGLAGVVDPDQLRALLLGRDPTSDAELLAAKGRPARVRTPIFR